MKIAAVQQEDRILYGGMIVAVTVCPSSRRCIPLNAIIRCGRAYGVVADDPRDHE
jgi:hypothetical protein